MATAMLDHVDHFFGLLTDLFRIGCFTAELGAQRGRGSWCWFEIVCDHPLFMNATAKNNERRLFIGVKNYLKGLGVALLGCRLN